MRQREIGLDPRTRALLNIQSLLMTAPPSAVIESPHSPDRMSPDRHAFYRS